MFLYDIKKTKDFCIQVSMKSGMGHEEAELFSDTLVSAQMRGIYSHGLTRLRHYTMRLKKGLVKSGVVPNVIRELPAILILDGKDGMGCWIAIQAMNMCIEKAKDSGCCFASINHCNHFGMAAYYTMHAANREMIGIAMSNTFATTVPIGGRKPMLGTNPLSIAVPSRKYPPLVLDMATSIVAKGKVIQAAKESKEIPIGWGVDAEGKNTTDPNAVINGGAMLPFGGVKGYAISFIIDILCTALSGACDSLHAVDFWDNDKKQDLGFFIGAFNIKSFLQMEDYYLRVDKMLENMRNTPPATDYDRVYIPGELEQIKSEKARIQGIEINEVVVKDLIKLGQECGVQWPF